MSELRNLENLLQKGKLTRREFLARVSVLGITAALSPVVLGGSARAAVPRKGGRLIAGVTAGSTSDSLDPAMFLDLMIAKINWQMRNNLVEIDPQGNAIPELAESWESSPDLVKWVFKLRRGVEFHNGKTLDAEDVIFSINHHRGEKSKSAAKVIVDPIKDIRADGKHTVVVTLNEGNADFAFLMSDYHLSIQPAGTTNFEDGIGTGGYILKSFEPGVRALTKRNPNYWKEGRAHFDEVETLGIADFQARTSALKTGSVHFINQCDSKTIHLLEKLPGIQVIETTGTRHFTIPMLTEVPPYDNNDVRLALKYAIDRKIQTKIIFRGHALPGNDHPIGPSQRFYASELAQREFDPDKAKFHMKKAGLEGHTFKLHTSEMVGGGIAVDSAILYKESAAKAGINIEVVREPTDGYWSDVWQKKPWCYASWSGRPTEDWMFSTAYAEDAAWNETHWKHERFNKLLKEARIERDQAKRREMYVEMQRIVRDEGGAVVFAFGSDLHAATTKLKFESLGADLDSDGCRFAERWWFES